MNQEMAPAAIIFSFIGEKIHSGGSCLFLLILFNWLSIFAMMWKKNDLEVYEDLLSKHDNCLACLIIC